MGVFRRRPGARLELPIAESRRLGKNKNSTPSLKGTAPTTMHEAQEDPLIGELVGGRYRVIRGLGEGGMGHVYLAEHEAIQKKIALKVLRTEYSRKEEIVSRFHQEAISASRIKHPNVLDVFDFGKLENGAAFLAMEYLEA